ncbi:MAG: Methionyl-tRNA formyltransferase [Alphaproteobacteria bacterium]|nr:Methionyl-tRNA formyltransferase [Alphaproteobacteria bacterium]
MRVIFMGSPEFSVGALKALHQAGHDIVAVYSQPPRPKGRGQGIEKTAVHLAAEEMGFPVFTPASLKPEEEVERFKSINADIAVVAAYGLILRRNILEAPHLGCINIHASILPRWRGAAPIQRAIEAGDSETGITIMQMDIGLDTGPMLMLEKTPIGAEDTAQTVHDRLAEIGARLIVETLKDIPTPVIQPEEGVTYAHKMAKEESLIDWSLSAAAIERKLRAFTPWPGLSFAYKGERLRVHQVQLYEGNGAPGTIIDKPFVIACGDNALAVTQIQRAGKNKQSIDEFCRGFSVGIGDIVA